MNQTEYCSMQEGTLDSYHTSILLSELIKSAQKDFYLLKGGIKRQDLSEWGTSPLFIERTAEELSLNGFLSALYKIKQRAADGQYDLTLYYQMVKVWSREICHLRTFSNSKLRQMTA